MKKYLFIGGLLFIIFSILSVLSITFLRIPPWHLNQAIKVSTAIGAKLACSGRYISELSKQQIKQDIVSYSAANELLEITYDEQQKTVEAGLWGLHTSKARFRQGLGCTLEIGNTQALDNIQVPDLKREEGDWPKGHVVNTIIPEYQKEIQQLMLQDNQKGLDTRALLVVKDGHIIAETYGEGYSHDTRFLGWSMAKSMTAILMGQLALQGKVTLSDQNLFKAWQNDSRSTITVYDLLTMTSGLKFDETYMPGSDALRMLFDSHSASHVALQATLKHKPKQYFFYSSGTSNLLSRLFYARVGNYPQKNINYFYKHILQPLSMHHTIFELDPSGIFVGSSYMYASARDWARLGLLMNNHGLLNGHRLFSTAWGDKAKQINQSKNHPDYGFQFWLNTGTKKNRWEDLPEDAYAMMGNRSQVVMMIPSKNMVIIRLGWTAGRYPTNENFKQILDSSDNLN